MAEQNAACVQSTLFQAGEGGYECFRIPAVVRAKSGAILAFAEGRKESQEDYADVDLALKRSLDNGCTWSELRFIVDDGDHTMGNPCPIVDERTGTIHLLFCRDNKQVLAMKSNDEGESWSAPVEISSSVIDRSFYFVFTGPGHGIQLSSGRLLAPSACAYGKRLHQVEGSYMIYSDDGGENWTIGGMVGRGMTDECEVVELADGRVYLTGRTQPKKRCRAYAHSDDGGLSWTAVSFAPALAAASCQGSIVRVSQSPPGDRNRIVMSNPANIYGRAELTLRMSYDEGVSWPVHKVLYEGSAAYSDLAVTAEGNILCLYEADDYTRIACARVGIGWFTE